MSCVCAYLHAYCTIMAYCFCGLAPEARVTVPTLTAFGTPAHATCTKHIEPALRLYSPAGNCGQKSALAFALGNDQPGTPQRPQLPQC